MQFALTVPSVRWSVKMLVLLLHFDAIIKVKPDTARAKSFAFCAILITDRDRGLRVKRSQAAAHLAAGLDELAYQRDF